MLSLHILYQSDPHVITEYFSSVFPPYSLSIGPPCYHRIFFQCCPFIFSTNQTPMLSHRIFFQCCPFIFYTNQTPMLSHRIFFQCCPFIFYTNQTPMFLSSGSQLGRKLNQGISHPGLIYWIQGPLLQVCLNCLRPVLKFIIFWMSAKDLRCVHCWPMKI